MNHPVETFGFRFTHGGRSLVYTGDTGETEACPTSPPGADVLLSEAAFLEGRACPPDLHLTARRRARTRPGPASAAGPHPPGPRERPGRARAEARPRCSAATRWIDVARQAGQVIDLG